MYRPPANGTLGGKGSFHAAIPGIPISSPPATNNPRDPLFWTTPIMAAPSARITMINAGHLSISKYDDGFGTSIPAAAYASPSAMRPAEPDATDFIR